MAGDTELQYLSKIGSGMNPVQRTRYNELVSQQGGGGGGGASAPLDYAALLRQNLQAQQEAYAPAVASLQASIPEIQARYGQQTQQLQAQQPQLEQRYQNLLNQITANQQKEEQRVSTAGARELGRRGISSQSGFYDVFQNQQLSPVTQYYTGQTADVGLGREESLRQLQNQIANVPTQQTEQERAIRNAMAQLQAGGSSQAIQNALQIFQQQQTQAQQAAQFAQQQQLSERELGLREEVARRPESLQTNVVTAGGRQLLVNTQTGQVIQDLGSSTAGAGGGFDVMEALRLVTGNKEPKPTAPPPRSTPSSGSGVRQYYA